MPGRDNLIYAKWSYASVRKHHGKHEVEICFADDNSSDGTWEWCIEMMKIDPLFKAIRNDSGQRLGHTILYDKLINEVCTNEVAMIWHCDMYLCPGALDEIEKLMYTSMRVEDPINYEESYKYKVDKITETFMNDNINNTKIRIQQHSGSYIITNEDGTTDLCWSGWILPVTENYKTIVSLTRIEPPLHPDGPEKYLADWGTEPDQFNEIDFLNWFKNGYKPKYSPPYTNGIFAPWAFFVKDFQEIGGHDPLYRPQSIEDTDIFNRFKLNGCTFVQTCIGCVYHFTSRGSRYNPTITTVGTNSIEWEIHNKKSQRNFIRKWGHFVQHTPLMDPIIPHKYDIGFIISNGDLDLLRVLEPWASKIYISPTPNLSNQMIGEYIKSEDTFFPLVEKFVDDECVDSDIRIFIDSNRFTDYDFACIQKITDIITDSGTENCKMELGSMLLDIRRIKSIENSLIKISTKYNENIFGRC